MGRAEVAEGRTWVVMRNMEWVVRTETEGDMR